MRLIERDLEGAHVVFSTRLGGVSEGPYESLNLGILTDDAADSVTENRGRLALGVGLEPQRIAMGWQVHGTELREWDAAPNGGGYSQPGAELDRVDGHLTSEPELGLLVLDPRTRQRLRINGRGLLRPEGIFLLADEVYGNCPKYIQRRRLAGETESRPAGRPARSRRLDASQRQRVAAADTFFIASFHPGGGADASHRGGRPGFVRVGDDGRIGFPDYPGNNMFNTLGNLAGHPRVGLLFVDFATGDLLHVAGRASLPEGPERRVEVRVEEVRETRGGSPLRWELVE